MKSQKKNHVKIKALRIHLFKLQKQEIQSMHSWQQNTSMRREADEWTSQNKQMRINNSNNKYCKKKKKERKKQAIQRNENQRKRDREGAKRDKAHFCAALKRALTKKSFRRSK